MLATCQHTSTSETSQGGAQEGRLAWSREREVAVLTDALSHALAVVALTTSTTAVSFAAGISSPITPVRQFSIFQCCIILAYLLLLLGAFVPLLVAWRHHLRRARSRGLHSTAQPTQAATADGSNGDGGISAVAGATTSSGEARGEAALRSPRRSQCVRTLALPLSAILRPADPTFWAGVAPKLYRRKRALVLGWLPLLVFFGLQCNWRGVIEPRGGSRDAKGACVCLRLFVFVVVVVVVFVE